MAESNKMKEMPVNKLMVQMGIPMILSMALQAVYNIVTFCHLNLFLLFCIKKVRSYLISWTYADKLHTL